MTQEKETGRREEIADLRRDVAKIHNHSIILKDVNFLNHIGYFCHDDHRAATITSPMSFSDRITLEGAPFQLDYTVTPDPRYGYPGTIAYKIWDWVDSALTFYGRPAKNPIFFDMSTLRQVCGLAKSGSNDKMIRRAINQLRHTDISTKCYRLGKNQWVKLTYRLIDSVLEFGEKNEARGGFLSISQNILTSYNNLLHLPLNKNYYIKALETSAARTLYALFFRAFYAARKAGQKTPVLSKDYRSLCAQLGYKPRLFKSKIKEQLGPHLDALAHKKVGLIESWDVQPNSNKNGFNIQIVASPGFEKTAITDTFQRPIPFLPPPPHSISDPTAICAAEAVVHFLDRRFGLTQDEGFMSPKDIANMKQFIDLLPAGTDPKEFINYCLNAASEQKIELASVGGMKIFVNSFLSKKHSSMKKTSVIEAKKKQEIQKDEIDSLQFDFLVDVWRIFELKNKDLAEKVSLDLHHTLMADRVTKAAYDTDGATGLVYSKMLANSKMEYAKKMATRDMWNAFLSQQGKMEFVSFCPVD